MAAITTLVFASAACVPDGSGGGPTTTVPDEGVTSIEVHGAPGGSLGPTGSVTVLPSDGDLFADGSRWHVRVFFRSLVPTPYIWSLDFMPPTARDLQPGPFEGATRYPSQPATRPGLSVSSNRYGGCNTLTGRYDVQQLEFTAEGYVSRFAATFEQHCDGSPETWTGTVRYRATEPFPVPVDSDGDGVPDTSDVCVGVVDPVQSDTDIDGIGDACDPEFERTSLVISADPRDGIAGGKDGTWFPIDGVFTAVTAADHSTVTVGFTGALGPWGVGIGSSGGPLVPGTYTGAVLLADRPPGVPGIDISNSFHCGPVDGAFTVNEISWTGNRLDRLSVDFEQHCRGNVAGLRGSVRYRATNP